jgi:hypothetical protein
VTSRPPACQRLALAVRSEGLGSDFANQTVKHGNGYGLKLLWEQAKETIESPRPERPGSGVTMKD